MTIISLLVGYRQYRPGFCETKKTTAEYTMSYAITEERTALMGNAEIESYDDA